MKDLFSLTAPQKALWLTEQYYQGSNVNNVCGTCLINDKFNVSVLKQAINNVLRSNSAFRLQLINSENGVMQYIADYSDIDFKVVDLNCEQDLNDLEQLIVNKPFKLFESFLFSITIFKYKDKTGGFVFNNHHLISDGFSLGLTCKKIMQEYSKLQDDNNLSNKIKGIIKNDNVSFSALFNEDNKADYLNYIIKEGKYFESNSFEKDKEYWEKKLEVAPNIISLSKNNSISLSSKAGRCEFSFGEDLTLKIKNYCKINKVSIFNFFMAVLGLYINKATNTNNFAIGTPVLNRKDYIDKQTNGLFVNIGPLIINVSKDGSFADFVKQIAIESMGLLRHERYPISESLKFLRNQNQDYSSLYNILFSYQITSSQVESDVNYKAKWVFNNSNADELDIQVFDFNDENDLKITYDYKFEKFSKNEIELLHDKINYLIIQIIELNQDSIIDLDVLLPNERHELLDIYNNTIVQYDKKKTIVELFEEQVKKTPYDVAVTFKNETITYRELNEKANVVAYYLRENYKIENGDFVAILQNRSINMIVSILGVVKSGATYVAIDPDYPIDRIEYMLENCNSKTVIVNEKTKDIISNELEKIDISSILNTLNCANSKSLEYNLPIITDAEDLLYVIYTSGSTGQPKGVSIKNYNVHNFIVGMQNIIDFSTVKSFVCLATCCFDMFVFELWGSLLNGLNMILADENEQKIPPLINKMCIKNKVDILQTTPSRLKLLLDNNETECLNEIKHIFIGGEHVPDYIFEELLKYPNITVHHMYGPTETTVWSTHKLITNTNKITIGKPIANTQVYILNDGRLAPRGAEGTIYIAGDGVGNGYLNRSKLTNSVFVPNVFDKTHTSFMYDTGDIGLINEYNELVYIGRADGQVKINGYRVELNEIENLVLSCEGIANAVVVKKIINNTDMLCCYYIEKELVDINEVKRILQGKLPIYMVPKFFVKMDEFPYTNNGKIDRKNMPMPKLDVSNELIVAARNDIDVKLISSICNSLEIDKLSIDKNLFEVGLDSLLAINLSVRIYNEFNVELGVNDIFNNPTVKAISDIIDNKINKNTSNDLDLKAILNNKKAVIEKAKQAEYYPISNSQRRIYLTCKNNENSVLYNVSGVIKFDSIVNVEILRNSLLALLNRNESFRTYFELYENDIVQRIAEDVDFSIDEKDLQELPEDKKKEYIEPNGEINTDNIMKDFIKPFDLKKAPLVRFKIIKNKDRVYVLIDSHHIICDGTSLNILANDLMKLYDGENLPELKLTYKDYSVWEQTRDYSKEYKKQEEFWLKQFEGELPLLNLPLVKSRPAIKSYKGAIYKYTIDTELFEKIKKCANEFNTTPNIILLCCYYILLYKYTNQKDIIIGMPISGRTLLELNNIVGVFINTLPIRFNINSKDTLKDTLNRLKDICSKWYSNQEYSLEDLASKLTNIRDNSRNFLFDTMFIYQSNNYTELRSDYLKCEVIRPNNNTSKYDISVEVMPNENNFTLTYEYCTDLFDEDFVKNFAYRYETIIENCVNNVDSKIQNVSMLDQKEITHVLNELNNTHKSFDYNNSLIKMFEKQVKLTPDNIAAVFEGKEITYKELNEKANQIAHYIEILNLNKNDFIGLMLPRSIEILICIWGCLKAGICYIPIDTALPTKRINYMLANSNTTTIFTFNTIAEEFSLNKKEELNVVDVELNTSVIYKNNTYKKKNLDKRIDVEQASYAIYTSGSTGKPKGIVLKQKALTNLTNYLNDYVEFLHNKRSNIAMLSITTISFDIFIFETIICMQAGLKIIMSSEQEQNSPILLDKLIEKYNVKCIQTTPSRMNLFVQNINLMPHLNIIENFILAGEPLPLELKNRLAKFNNNVKVYNGYGPSETTVFSSFTDVTKQEEITIGKPLYNTYAYLLDEDLNLLPEGIPGELYISGDGVGKYYINNEKITKERFLKDPFNEGIMYRTGDLVKWLPNGDLHYVGRNDNQVKIRGLRIELDEIEKCILSYKGITKCIVHVKKDENNREFVVAYFMANDRVNVHELRKYVAQNLPKYMIPTYFVLLDKLPYLPNGKVDKKSLPEPEKEQNLDNKNFIPPETTIELQIANIFSSLLGIDSVSINDNFFELGGDSLLAINLQIELNKLGYNITYADLFLNSTIQDIESYILTHTSKEDKEKTTVIDSNIGQYNQMINDYTRPPKNIVSRNIGNVLITGSTGFLGSHVLEQFLLNETGIAYVVVRPEKGMTLREKFLKKLHYYFGDKYDKLIDRRIIIMSIDITKSDLGSTWRELKVMFNNISTVINCAAIVSHFGNYNVFKDINVNGVKNLLELCKQYKKRFVQISTVSISGVNLSNNPSQKRVVFSENDLYIEQPLDNVYVKSKFEAEKLVLDYINQGVDAYIMRVGNLTNRFSDMKFQPNSKENAFVQRIISFIKLQTIPDYLLQEHLEFTPVDLCSQAIISLIQASNGKNRIFHVFNDNEVSIIDFVTCLDSHDYKIKIVSEEEFSRVLKTTVSKKDSSLILGGIMKDLNKEQKFQYHSNIIVSNEFTNMYLKDLFFKWPEINNNYLNNFIEFLLNLM